MKSAKCSNNHVFIADNDQTLCPKCGRGISKYIEMEDFDVSANSLSQSINNGKTPVSSNKPANKSLIPVVIVIGMIILSVVISGSIFAMSCNNTRSKTSTTTTQAGVDKFFNNDDDEERTTYLKANSIDASSYAENLGYLPGNYPSLVDDDLDSTAWITSNNGVNEYLDFSFDKGTKLTQITINPGFLRNSDTFSEFSAPEKIEISTGSKTYTYNLGNTSNDMDAALDGYVIDLPSDFTCKNGHVKLKILSTRNGSEVSYCAISEILFVGIE